MKEGVVNIKLVRWREGLFRPVGHSFDKFIIDIYEGVFRSGGWADVDAQVFAFGLRGIYVLPIDGSEKVAL